MSTIKVTNIQHPDAASPAITLDASGVSALSGFSSSLVKQVEYVNFDTPVVINAMQNDYTDIPSFEVSITPESATSKILILFSVSSGRSAFGDYASVFRVARNGSMVNPPPGPSGRIPAHISIWGGNNAYIETASTLLVDSPNSTSALTYKVQCTHNVFGEAWDIHVNRSQLDADDAQYIRTVSTLLVAELAI